ncbi:21024_t:CDS:1, partial [Gigaspora margarita]
IMNQSNQAVGTHSQIINGHQQRNTNNGGPQSVIGQFQGVSNIGVQLPRLQNTANRFNGAFIDIQQYADLINGTNPFIRVQGIEHSPQQSIQFSTLGFQGFRSHKHKLCIIILFLCWLVTIFCFII